MWSALYAEVLMLRRASRSRSEQHRTVVGNFSKQFLCLATRRKGAKPVRERSKPGGVKERFVELLLQKGDFVLDVMRKALDEACGKSKRSCTRACDLVPGNVDPLDTGAPT